MITHGMADVAVLRLNRIVMMTNGPSARIGEILHVPLILPRGVELASDATYIRCRSAVLKFDLSQHVSLSREVRMF